MVWVHAPGADRHCVVRDQPPPLFEPRFLCGEVPTGTAGSRTHPQLQPRASCGCGSRRRQALRPGCNPTTGAPLRNHIWATAAHGASAAWGWGPPCLGHGAAWGRRSGGSRRPAASSTGPSAETPPILGPLAHSPRCVCGDGAATAHVTSTQTHSAQGTGPGTQPRAQKMPTESQKDSVPHTCPGLATGS